jgi:hypothetical protein
MTTDSDASPPPDDLSVIAAGNLPPSAPDDKALEEEMVFERAKKGVELDSLKQDLAERKSYAKYIFILICAWLGAMFLLLAIQGALSPHHWFGLSDGVLVAVIGGTTINVLGIFIIVVKYLFPKRP